MDEKIVAVLNEMSEYLSISQMKKLQEVILKTFSENEVKKTDHSNLEYLQLFVESEEMKKLQCKELLTKRSYYS